MCCIGFSVPRDRSCLFLSARFYRNPVQNYGEKEHRVRRNNARRSEFLPMISLFLRCENSEILVYILPYLRFL